VELHQTPLRHEIPCPACPQKMRIVGRERHPESRSSRTDMLTFQCDCGQIFTTVMTSDAAIVAGLVIFGRLMFVHAQGVPIP
jgi:hypothetical protein